MFAHAMGHGVFRRKRQRGGRREKKTRGEREKNPLKKSGGHMSPLLLSVLLLQDLMLNFDSEDENKVEQAVNGGKKRSVSPLVTNTTKLKAKYWTALDTLQVKATLQQ